MEFLIIKNWTLYSYAAFVALLVGGIDLGLYGILGINLFRVLLGGFLGRLVSLGIGIAAGYLIYLLVIEKKQATPPPSA
jgi:uncharacterized membrane protein YuzA (DUF378 family)